MTTYESTMLVEQRMASLRHEASSHRLAGRRSPRRAAWTWWTRRPERPGTLVPRLGSI